jgi:hypothetical protein
MARGLTLESTLPELVAIARSDLVDPGMVDKR